MAKQTLTDSQIRSLLREPVSKARKISDGGGLFLLQTPTGSPKWRQKYYIRSGNRLTERQACHGKYPEVSLAQAREKAADLRKQRAAGLDPVAEKKRLAFEARRQETRTLGMVTEAWYKLWSAKKAKKTLRSADILLRDLTEMLGALPIADVTVADCKALLRHTSEKRGAESAHRLLDMLSGRYGIFRYAVAEEYIDRDPAGSLRIILPAKPKVTHHPAITDPVAFGGLLRTIRAWPDPGARCGLELVCLTLARPGELLAARWEQITLDGPNPVWTYEATKTGTQKMVPLSRQAVLCLRELKSIADGVGSPWVCTGVKQRAHESLFSLALRRMGFEGVHVPHGFRASGRTMMDEVLGIEPHLIEHVLGHRVRDINGRAYNRTRHLDGVRAAMQQWADWCDDRRAGVPLETTNVIPFERPAEKDHPASEAPRSGSVAARPTVAPETG